MGAEPDDDATRRGGPIDDWLPSFAGSSTPTSHARSPNEALQLVTSLFGTPDTDGIAMAVRAARTVEAPATSAGSLQVEATVVVMLRPQNPLWVGSTLALWGTR